MFLGGEKLKVLLTIALILLAGCGKILSNRSTGDIMKILLDVDTSSNYIWFYSIMDANVIDLKTEEFLTPADDETLDGEAQVLTFKAFNEGETEIIFSCTNRESSKIKYDLTCVITVDENNNIKVKSKSGKYSKKLLNPVIYTETNDEK